MKFEIANDLRAKEADHVGGGGKFVSGEWLLGDARPANDVPAFQDKHGSPCLGQVRGGNEPVVAGADHDDVVSGFQIHPFGLSEAW
jgi:hypothetical protein